MDLDLEFIQLNLEVHQKEWLMTAAKIRAFEKVMIEQFGSGQVRGTFHTSNGQELTSVMISSVLAKSDYVFGNHRAHALYLAMSGNYEGLASEVLGREGGSSKGIGGSQHLQFQNFYSNGIQGGMSAIATGAAINDQQVSVCMLGDGTLGEGAVYESLNLASVLSSPTFFVLEDNEIAQSTISQFQRAGNIADRFAAFAIQCEFVDSANADELFEAIQKGIKHVRTKKGPFALHIKSYRLGAHSKGDDNRSLEEINEGKSQEVLSIALSKDKDLKSLFEDYVVNFSELIAKVKTKPLSSSISIDFAEELILGAEEFISSVKPDTGNLREAVYLGLKTAFTNDSELIMIGEDIEYLSAGTSRPYGGAFGVSKDLSVLFPGRVLNSPISESAITGYGIGRALSGRPTIVEIMFGDFVTLIVDAMTQQASKIVSMYGHKIELPLLVRTPSGGRRGYGPTHSQSLESLFIGIPNLVIYSQNLFSSSSHYSELLNLGLPIMVFENKDLYGVQAYEYPTKYFDTVISKNNNITLKSRFKETRSTILTYGYATNLVLEASKILVQKNELFVNIVVPQIISPLNLEFASEVLRNTDTLYLVEECNGSAGLAALVLLELQRLDISLDLQLISGKGIIGASEASESAALISVEKIVTTLVEKV